MLYGEINRQRLKIINEHVVADTIDYLEARFAFSEDWDGLEKWVHFAKDGEVYDIRLTDDCIRKEDHLNLSAGIWKVYLHGNEFSGGKVIERITTNQAILRVEPTGALNGEPFPEIPASVTEQIFARLDEVEQNGGGSGGGITNEIDPTVPDWAKQPKKPTYTAEEVGAATEEQFNQLSDQLSEAIETIPKVFDWALAGLPFTEAQISDTERGAGFVVNPTNYADGKTYFRYHAGASYGFRWTNPNPQKGSLTITMRGYSQYSETLSTKIVTVYTDGTDNSLTNMMYLKHGETVTYTTDPDKTVAYIRGNYDFENWVLLDMSVLSIVADCPAPTGTVKSINGVEPDENGNVEIAIPPAGGSGGTDIALGISGATVGQIARITAVDDSGVPTAWEPADWPGGGTSDEWDVHYKVNITEALPNGFEITEIDGNPLRLKEMWAMVKLQNGGSAGGWYGCTVKTDNKNTDAWLSGTGASNGGVNINSGSYAYFVYHALVIGNGRALCEIMAGNGAIGSWKTITNRPWLNNWLDYYPVQYITGITCENNLGSGTSQGYGTEIEIWGKSL